MAGAQAPRALALEVNRSFRLPNVTLMMEVEGSCMQGLRAWELHGDLKSQNANLEGPYINDVNCVACHEGQSVSQSVSQSVKQPRTCCVP